MSEQVLIGSRIRVARLAKGLTLETVAKAAGLTQGYVSKLERDQVSPSVATLVALCSAVGLHVGQLFEPPPTAIVRAGEGAQINFGGEGVHESVITPGDQTDIEVIRSLIDPGGSGGSSQYVLDCDVEFIFVIKGSLEIFLGESAFTLDQGDAMTLRGREPHTWQNASATHECEVIWALAPSL